MRDMSRKVKVIVEKHEDGYIAYPLGLRNGVAIVGQGDAYQEALTDLASALRFTLETARESDVFDEELPVLDAVVVEIEVPLSVQVPG